MAYTASQYNLRASSSAANEFGGCQPDVLRKASLLLLDSAAVLRLGYLTVGITIDLDLSAAA